MFAPVQGIRSDNPNKKWHSEPGDYGG